MLTLYLACLVFGGVLLAISLFSGGDSGSDMDHSLDAHGDFAGDHSLDAQASDLVVDQAMEVHADMAGHLPVDAHIDAAHPAIVSMEQGGAGEGAPTVHSAFEYFSFRNFVYTTTFFGLTGSVLTWLAMPSAVTLLSSVGMGIFAGYVGHRFMRYLRASESGEALHVATLIGHPATVSLPPSKQGKGKVRVENAGQIIEMLALLHEDSEAESLAPGERVFIVAIDRDVAYVDRADFIE